MHYAWFISDIRKRIFSFLGPLPHNVYKNCSICNKILQYQNFIWLIDNPYKTVNNIQSCTEVYICYNKKCQLGINKINTTCVLSLVLFFTIFFVIFIFGFIILI